MASVGGSVKTVAKKKAGVNNSKPNKEVYY
jgi:hypothetical protein